MKAYGITDIGRNRSINQDYVFVSTEAVGNLPNLFVVADGMGGHKSGDYASKRTTEIVLESIEENRDKSIESVITKAISDANAYIYRKSQSDEVYQGMGTTLVIATIVDGQLITANIGDSRLYLISDGKIRQITEDHSLVAEMFQLGQITAKEAREHPDKNIITRAVGTGSFVKADFFKTTLHARDQVLMCSDGLTNMLEDEVILQVASADADITDKASAMVNRANQEGGKDNIAVIIIEPELGEV